jgi:hypothetical protein
MWVAIFAIVQELCENMNAIAVTTRPGCLRILAA